MLLSSGITVEDRSTGVSRVRNRASPECSKSSAISSSGAGRLAKAQQFADAALGQIREPWFQVGFGITNESAFRREAQQGLDDGERDEFSIGESRGDTDLGAFWSPLGVIIE